METMTLSQFLNDSYKISKSNNKLYKLTVFVLANFMYIEKVKAADINVAGNKILGISRNIGYWACLIMATIEIIKALVQGDTKSITSIITKYSIGYAALFLLPWLFDLIRSIFS